MFNELVELLVLFLPSSFLALFPLVSIQRRCAAEGKDDAGNNANDFQARYKGTEFRPRKLFSSSRQGNKMEGIGFFGWIFRDTSLAQPF